MTRSDIENLLEPFGKCLDKVTAHGCEEILSGQRLSDEALTKAVQEVWRMGGQREHVDYSIDGVGLFYALSYHLFRTRILVDELASWFWEQRKLETPLRIYDFGSGTGATTWAVAIILAAYSERGVDLPLVELTAVERSKDMINAAEVLWRALKTETCVEVPSYLKLSTQQSDWKKYAKKNARRHDGSKKRGGRTLIVTSFLWAPSDSAPGHANRSALRRAVGRLRADHLLMATIEYRARELGLASMDEFLSDNASSDWTRVEHCPLGKVWKDTQARVTALRNEIVRRLNSRGYDGGGTYPVKFAPEIGDSRHEYWTGFIKRID